MKIIDHIDLQKHLNEYIDYVKSGDEVIITDQGIPIAKIVPVDNNSRDNERRNKLIRHGIIRPGKGPISIDLLNNLPSMRVSKDDIERIISEDRED